MQRTRIEKHESLIHQVINEYLIKKGKGFLKNEVEFECNHVLGVYWGNPPEWEKYKG